MTDEHESDPDKTEKLLASIRKELRRIRILLTLLLCLAVTCAATVAGGYLIDRLAPFIFWVGLAAVAVLAIYFFARYVWKPGHDAAKE